MLLVAGITGDVVSMSALAAALPTLLIEAKYSRTFEAEADDYALIYMQDHQISPQHLINMLTRLGTESASPEGALAYLSSHPATGERIERLQEAARQGLSESSPPG